MAKGKKTGGRTKGTPNKVNAELKDMILTALEKAGGVAYLQKRAQDTPGPFLALVGKVLPMQVTGAEGKDLIPGAIQFVITQAPNSENQT